MNISKSFQIIIYLIFIILLVACAPSTDAVPTVDVVSTMAVELAVLMQTQTALAIPPTPVIPTASATLSITETPTTSPPTEEVKRNPPYVVTFTACHSGPGEPYKFISNIDPSIRKSGKQVVEILGVGSEPGWVVIRNPYFNNPCWVKQEFMEIGPHIILSDYPVMTPGP
ncbi:MAG: hypothetical protein JNM46_02335 [Anaerolineales bacterium]|nr:hypothetical protein [Anaerolineales bacterium]